MAASHAKPGWARQDRLCSENSQFRLQELDQGAFCLGAPGGLVITAGRVPPIELDASQQDVRELQVVLETERRLGFEPVDVSPEKRGYDVESHVPGSGRLRFIEVKGRVAGARTVNYDHGELLARGEEPFHVYEPTPQ